MLYVVIFGALKVKYFFFLHFCKVTLRVQFQTLILKTKWYDFLYTPLSLPPLSSSTLGTDRTEL